MDLETAKIIDDGLDGLTVWTRRIHRLRVRLDAACVCAHLDPAVAAQNAHEAVGEFLRITGGPEVATAYRDAVQSVRRHREFGHTAEISMIQDRAQADIDMVRALARKEGNTEGFDKGYNKGCDDTRASKASKRSREGEAP